MEKSLRKCAPKAASSANQLTGFQMMATLAFNELIMTLKSICTFKREVYVYATIFKKLTVKVYQINLWFSDVFRGYGKE